MSRRYRLSVLLLVSFVATSAHAEDRYFDSDGVRIRYVVEGEGEPVVLIHGFAATAELNWLAVRKPLAKDYRVIAMDLRGHGKSGKPHEPEQYGAAMAEDVVRLLDHLEIPKAHVVGYSLGAMVTAKLVATHPGRVLSATLGGAAGFPDDPRAWAVAAAAADSVERGAGLWPLFEALRPADRPRPKLTATQLAVANAVLSATNDVRALAAVLRGARGLVVDPEDVRRINVPVLAIVGSFDPLKASADGWKALLPSMRIAVIDNADHMRAPSRPEFLRELRNFLDEHRLAEDDKVKG